MRKYERLQGEQDEALIYRVCKDKEEIGTWQDVADILNPLLGTDYGESTFRKKFAAFNQMFEANRERFTDSKKEIADIREEQRRLSIEKIKFRDERNAWNKQNYLVARQEDILDKLTESLQDIGRIQFPVIQREERLSNDRSILVLLSDTHFGQTFDSFWGKYNTDIAKDRMGQLLSAILEIKERHDTSNCVVAILGDVISGSIHRNIQVTNREDVIEQIKVATEIISSFCYELSKVFSTVQMIGVSGNHSRLVEKKDTAMHNERLDDLIYWGVDLALGHTGNFEYVSDANLDIGIAALPLHGKNYIFTHGDMDSFSKSGIQNLITMLHMIPEAVFCGHRHVCAIDDCNGIKMVQSGSLVGTGDQFTIEKRIYGKPSQMICVCSDKGLETFYPVELE